jgi:hypothetical protein
MKTKITILTLTMPLWTVLLMGQDETTVPSQREFVEQTFTATTLINTQTTKVMPAKSWSFEMQHRFGKVGIDSSMVQEFLGLDLPATVRFAFGWSITDRLHIKVGRTNYQKTYDFEGKYLLLRQTTDFSIPVSVALFFNAAVRTERFPNVPANAYYADEATPFAYKSSHRLSYNTQAIISSKITDNFSMQLNPMIIYQNLVPRYYDNYTAVLATGLRYKFGLRTSFIAEYAYVFNNRGRDFFDPFSLGIEMGTAGHVFQVFVGNASKIIEQHAYTNSGLNMADGQFLLGFNLQRYFWRK